MKQAPKWAQELTFQTLIFLKAKEVPNLTWRHRRYQYSSGWTRLDIGVIRVSAGSDHLDAKLTLLHELAHFTLHMSHTPEFWDRAWKLYRWANLPIRYCQWREYSYKVEAKKAYQRSLKEGKS